MFQFRNGHVVNSETGEVIELTGRVSILSAMMKEYEEKKAAFEAENARLIETIEVLKENIKKDVLVSCKGVSDNGLIVSWVKGKTGWDTKQLSEYAKTHSELNRFRKVGDPYVTFTLQKEKGLKGENK